MSKDNLTWREFRSPGSGKKSAPNVWMIAQDGDTYYTRHGMLGGAMQEFSDKPGDKGKSGTKAYMSAQDNCGFHIEREIRKKTERGYVEYINGVATEESASEIVFTKCLPKNLCSYKPQTDIDEEALVILHKAGRTRYTRKYDGMMHLAVHHPWGWEIYSRRMDLASERFPHHIEFLSTLADHGVGTILVGEILCLRPDGTDDLQATSRICRSDPPVARKLIADGECPEPTYQIFDVLFWEGNDLSNKTYDERSIIWSTLPKNDFVRPVKLEKVTPENWEETAKKNSWEGFVVVDGLSVPGAKFYSFDGTPGRPRGHHKLKPTHSEDVVVFAATHGGGKRLDTIGAVFVKQIHPETKQWFNCGKIGSGFTDESLIEMEGLIQKYDIPVLDKDKDAEKINLDAKSNVVIQIEYKARMPGTNKFRHGVICRVRDDKAPKECVAQRLAASDDDAE